MHRKVGQAAKRPESRFQSRGQAHQPLWIPVFCPPRASSAKNRNDDGRADHGLPVFFWVLINLAIIRSRSIDLHRYPQSQTVSFRFFAVEEGRASKGWPGREKTGIQVSKPRAGTSTPLDSGLLSSSCLVGQKPE